jgi:hypothetical protein
VLYPLSRFVYSNRRSEPAIPLADRDHAEGVDVDHRGGHVGAVAHAERQAADRDRVRERRDREVDVGAAGEVGAVGAVHLAPPARAVGAEPQVGLIEITEQQELTHLPGRGEAQHVGDRFSADLAGRGPALVLPAQRQGLEVLVVPRPPSGGVAVGREGGQRVGHGHPG